MANDTLLLKAMTYQRPETIPVQVSILPAAWLEYPGEILPLMRRYPGIFGKDPQPLTDSWMQGTYGEGEHVDEWGCVWTNIRAGMDSYVTGHPLPTRESVRALRIPDDRTGRLPHGLMYLRLLDLRGFEEAMIDFAEEAPELQLLIDKVLEYNLLQLDAALPKHTGPIVYLGDDLGMQHGLAIGRDKWVRYMKPCFEQIYGKIHSAGKRVYMHTDGCIWEIMPDLHEAGADMINPQFRANGLENLVRVCKGKIPINLDLDRQMLPYAKPGQLAAHVRECVEALYLPEGGLGLMLETGPGIPLSVIEEGIAALDEIQYYRGQ